MKMNRLKILSILSIAFSISCSNNPEKAKLMPGSKVGSVKIQLTPKQEINPLPFGFNAFMEKFNSDSAFQMAHVKFPLKITFVDELEGDSTKYLSKAEWVNVKFISGDKEIYKRIPVSKTEVNVLYQLEDTGVHTNNYFNYINGDWMLVFVKDESD